MSIRNIELHPYAVMVGDESDWVANPFAINYGHGANAYYEDDYIESDYVDGEVVSYNVFDKEKDEMETLVQSIKDMNGTQWVLGDGLEGIFVGYNAKLYNTIALIVENKLLKVMIFNIGSVSSSTDTILDATVLLELELNVSNGMLLFDYPLFRATALMYDDDSFIEFVDDVWVKMGYNETTDLEMFSSLRKLVPSKNLIKQLKGAFAVYSVDDE